MGRGIPLAVSPHPETCQPCRYMPAGIGHSLIHPSGSG